MTEPVWPRTRFSCKDSWLFCTDTRLFCGYVGLLRTNPGSVPTQDHMRVISSLLHHSDVGMYLKPIFWYTQFSDTLLIHPIFWWMKLRIGLPENWFQEVEMKLECSGASFCGKIYLPDMHASCHMHASKKYKRLCLTMFVHGQCVLYQILESMYQIVETQTNTRDYVW